MHTQPLNLRPGPDAETQWHVGECESAASVRPASTTATGLYCTRRCFPSAMSLEPTRARSAIHLANEPLPRPALKQVLGVRPPFLLALRPHATPATRRAAVAIGVRRFLQLSSVCAIQRKPLPSLLASAALCRQRYDYLGRNAMRHLRVAFRHVSRPTGF